MWFARTGITRARNTAEALVVRESVRSLIYEDIENCKGSGTGRFGPPGCYVEIGNITVLVAQKDITEQAKA